MTNLQNVVTELEDLMIDPNYDGKPHSKFPVKELGKVQKQNGHQTSMERLLLFSLAGKKIFEPLEFLDGN